MSSRKNSTSITDPIRSFVDRWSKSGGAERANYSLFLTELCDLLELPHPDPKHPDGLGDYVFEREVTHIEVDGSTSRGRIDLYKRSCFVLETKQGVTRESDIPTDAPRTQRRGHGVRGTPGWDQSMMAARTQAERYARALPQQDGWPPFLVIVDVGYSFELYADFTRSGKTYTAFPDANSHRIFLEDLARDEIRERLRLLWTDPLALDESRKGDQVTREVSDKLAKLARSLERDSGHEAHRVARFLMRCLFTMYAEDVGLIPENSFRDRLIEWKNSREIHLFHDYARALWETMAKGGFSPILKAHVLQFNGGLFEDAEALPLTAAQFDSLIDAANAGWKDVEPAIFGTLLERALEPTERHKLGAHFTPKAYVERLVMPTIIEPLTDEWRSVEAAALAADNAGKKDEAIATIKAFLRKLCDTKVLDPACGTGNFLYVTMEHMKRLEGEIWDRLRGLGETQTFEGFGLTVDPHQFLGIEINPRAAAIADLVLWIGYLRWHLRTFGGPPKEPILRKYENIECRDAILAYDRAAPLLDDEDNHVTRWDRVSMKKHPVTGKDVPDDSQRLQVLEYMNPKKTEWPPADFIVGNPPYIGVRQLRTSVGDPYVRALAVAYPEIPETSDYVMYWWDKAARAIASGQTRQFGLITTNSIVQAYSRRLLESHIGDKGAIKLAFAIADHPWVDAADGAAVRVALTVGCAASDQGNAVLGAVQGDEENSPVMLRTVDRIGSSLDEASVHERIETLLANRDTCFQGVVPAGEGFKLDSLELKSLGFSESTMHRVIRPYIIGKDLVQIPRKRYIIDFFGMSKDEARLSAPTLFQRLLDHVYPDRARNNRATYRDRWWLFAEPRPGLRRAVKGLSRFIVTPYTAKFRPFIFVSTETLPDAMAYAVASDDAFILGVLSSLAHSAWSRMTGGTLENRPRYNSDATFLPFPFPISGVKNQARIRTLAEQLDAHRKARQSEHPTLTLTGMYNVLEKLRNGEPLTAKERTIHDQGLISVLKQIHDDLDAAVFDAYGWPHNLTHDQILERLVALNHERAAEEKRGLIRWLRPEFQNPTDKSATASSTQTALPMEPTDEPATAAKPRRKANGKTPWPTTPTEQAQTIREALAAIGPATPEQIARTFHRANKSKVKELLSAMATLGQVRELRDGNFSLNSPAGSISTQLKENS